MTPGARRRALLAAATAAGTVAVLTALVLVAGASPADALSALVRGAAGSSEALGETLTRATSIVLCAAGAVLAFRAGVLNIGLDGQFLMGAAAAAAVGPLLPGSPGLVRLALLLAAPAAGALFAAPAAWLAERRGVPAVLSTIFLNLVAAAAVSWFVRGPLQDPTADYPESRPVATEVRLAPLASRVRTTAAFPAALLLAAAERGLFLSRTTAGLGSGRLVRRPPPPGPSASPTRPFARERSWLGRPSLVSPGGFEVVAVTGPLYDPFGSGVGYLGIAAPSSEGRAPGAPRGALLRRARARAHCSTTRGSRPPSPRSSPVFSFSPFFFSGATFEKEGG